LYRKIEKTEKEGKGGKRVNLLWRSVCPIESKNAAGREKFLRHEKEAVKVQAGKDKRKQQHV